MLQLIDTHSHIYEPEFDEDREEVIARARQAGVEQILLPAIDHDSHPRMLALAVEHADICLPMMGLHPTSVNDNPRWREELAEVDSYLASPPEGVRFVGVGEIGLDLYWSQDYREEQMEAFEQQCRMALRYDLPIAVHTRNAYNEMAEVIEGFRGTGLRGVFHAFGEDVAMYERLRQMGDFKFGIGGVCTYKKAQIAMTLADMALEDIVLETDCPYLTPVPYRGKRNESAYVEYVCRRIAEIKSLTAEEVARVSTATARKLFFCPQSK